jgi:hypothetical protein
MTTTAPSAAKLVAIARPIPELAPVMMAVLPASKLDIGEGCGSVERQLLGME